MGKKNSFKNALLSIVSVILFSAIFLSIGMDSPGHNQTRMAMSGLFVVICFLRGEGIKFIFQWKSLAFWSFFSVFLFEIIRALLPSGMGSRFPLPAEHVHLYAAAILPWGLYFFLFVGAYYCFNRKSVVNQILALSAVVSFFLSSCIIFPLYQNRVPYYRFNGHEYFFPPVFYIHDWVGKYMIAPYAHPNRIGDILSVGFFAALGILSYFFLRLRDCRRLGNEINRREWEWNAIIALFALVTGAVILLLFSRGTIGTVVIVFLGCFVAIAVKFPSKYQWGILAGVITVFVLFFLWAGNLKSALKEVRTLEIENQVKGNDLNKTEYKSRSIFMNQEGARRALKIHEDYPVLGVGTQGYKLISREYSSAGDYKNLKNPDYYAWSHYLQLLAEEGIGAYLYFLFLLFYVFELIRGMLRTKSQFKFMAALSFAAPVFVIMIHASIIETMQRFTVASMVYLLMGASLSVLRKDFDHEA